MFFLTSSSIDTQRLNESLEEISAGALVVFEGRVRNHNEGKSVSSLEYQVYEELVQKEGAKILKEAREKFNIHGISCAHRYGHLSIGEVAVWVGAISSHRDDAFRAARFVIDEIKLRLPIWKKEHYTNQTPEWVFCRHHHTHVHFSEDDYYQKQVKLADPSKLKNSRVMVVGAGGLGCPALTALTCAGIGKIQVVDNDGISISNIHRQPLYSPEVVGEKKVSVAIKKLRNLNPFIEIEGIEELVTVNNVERLISGNDIVLDCTDNLATKYLLHDACFRSGLPLISASIYQFEGQLRTFVPRSDDGCLRCITDVTPDDSKLGNCNDFGVLASSVGALGNLQANEAILYLLLNENNSTKETIFFNFKHLTQMKLRNHRKDKCKCCSGKFELEQSVSEVTAEDLKHMNALLIDVRSETDEVLTSHLNSEIPIVVCCHKGIRSKRLVEELRSKGHMQFYSLKGGACSL